MSSLHPRSDMQYESVEFVNFVFFYDFRQDIFKIEGELKIEWLNYLRASIVIIFEDADSCYQMLSQLSWLIAH